MRIKHQFRIRDASPDRQPKIQSSLVRENFQRIMVQTNNDCRFQILILTNSTTPATFACWKIRFKTEVCTCSQFPTEAMHWIKEVVMVVSVDDLNIFVISKRNSNARFWSIPCEDCFSTEPNHPYFSLQKKGQSGGTKSTKRGPFPSWKTDCLLDLRVLLVTGVNDSVESYADLFTSAPRNDDIPEFDSKWNGILLSMTKITPDDILEGLDTKRNRESEKLKTVSELYDLEIHQKKAGPDYHRLKTMVKRSIEQDIRNRNFGARTGNYERNAVVKNQGTKHRGQRILGDCWQWEANGQCSKGDNCSFRHDFNKRAKMTQPNPSPSSFMQQNERNASRTRRPRGKSPSGRMSRWPCKDHLKGTFTNSFCEKWHPPKCLFYKTKNRCRFGEKCSYAHHQVEEQPSKRSIKNGDKSAVAMLKSTRQLGFVSQDMEPPKSSSILRKSSDILKPTRCVRFTKAVVRHANIRDENPSLGMICPGGPHQRSSNAPKFEDRSQEETEWQEQGAREAAWRLAKSVLKWKEKNRATFFSPSENRCLPASTLQPEERELVVDSGASVHMISKQDLNDAEMDTLTKSCSPTIVITANGEVQTHEEAKVYVKELGIFLTMKVIENTPAVLSLGKLCDENGYSYERINGQTPHLIKKRDSDTMQHEELRSYRGSRLVNEFFLQFLSFNFNDSFKTGEALFCIFFKLVFFTHSKWYQNSRKRGSNWKCYFSSACVKFQCWR